MSKTIYLIAKHPKMVILGVCIKGQCASFALPFKPMLNCLTLNAHKTGVGVMATLATYLF